MHSVEVVKKLRRRIKRQKDFGFVNDLLREKPTAQVFIVGGIIRDTFLGRSDQPDFDFVVRGVPARTLRNFLAARGWVGLVGKNFGVYKFKPCGGKLLEAIDIALPRTDFPTGGGGYRDFAVQSDPSLPIEKDLARRDFTINALAIDLHSGKLLDPFHGRQDLREKRIRTVGDPGERFREDYSRILRALRLAVKLNFNIVRPTWQMMKKLAAWVVAERLVNGRQTLIVPTETLVEEFLKAFSACPDRTIELYDQSGVLQHILPELEAMKGVAQPIEFHREGDVWQHTMKCLATVPSTASQALKLSLLFHDIGKPPTQKLPAQTGDRIRFNQHDAVGAELTKKICRRLRLSNKLTEHVVWLVRNHMLFVMGEIEDMRPRTIKKYFIDYPDRGDDLLELYRWDVAASQNSDRQKNLRRHRAVVAHVNKMRRAFKKTAGKTFRHIVDGNDIMKTFGLKPGPAVGRYLTQADDFIFHYIVRHRAEPEKEKVLDNLEKSIS